MREILVVDDETDMRSAISMILKKNGYTNVVEASNGEECLKRIKESDPDLVIMDIMMPDMDGWEVCKKIKEHNPKLPVSLLSVMCGMDDVRKSLDAGADWHLAKPIHQDEILRAASELGHVQPDMMVHLIDLV